jgi:hypothetical protein
LHAPAVHVSAVTPQFWQVAPPVPQVIAFGLFTQVPLLQQPVQPVQPPPVQVWFEQVPPSPQLPHAPPPLPQAPGAVPATQLPLASQQPLGHEVGVHWQAPSTHSLFAGQAVPLVPQTQPPSAPQLSVARVHAPQAAPFRPHLVASVLVALTQVLPEQQPEQPDAGLHTHMPAS